MLALYLSMLEDDGDKAIFTEIYEQYERKIYAVAMHLTSSAPKAEDAVPDNVHPESEFRALVGEIRGMPEKYRRVLELRLVLEWSFDEIGRELDIAENTARTRFQRGRIMLRERLEAMGYNDKGRVL